MSNPRWHRCRSTLGLVAESTVVALGLLVAAGAASPPAAGASTVAVENWTDGPCPTSSGVTVVVDFQELGGTTLVRCAAGRPASGRDVLTTAGIDYREALRSAGFVCRINNKPANDPCVNASPTNAYWSYWLAVRGGQWCYSGVGAATLDPVEGTVQGWSFSLNRSAGTAPPPRVAVPAAVADSPTSMGTGCRSTSTSTTTPPPVPPVTAAPPPTAPRQAARPPDTGTPPGSATPGGPAASPQPAPTAVAVPGNPPASPASAEPAAATTSSVPPATTTEVVRAEVAAATETRSRNGTGSPTGLLAGGGLVAGLAAVAVVLHRRGRHR